MSILKALLTIPFRIVVTLWELIAGLGVVVLAIMAVVLVFGVLVLAFRFVARWGMPLLGGGFVVLVAAAMDLTDWPWLWGGTAFAILAAARRWRARRSVSDRHLCPPPECG